MTLWIGRAAEAAHDGRVLAQRQADATAAQYDAEFPYHGVAFHRLAQVFHRPGDPVVAGYLRRGSRFRAKSGVEGPGCEGKWYLVDGGGLVCGGRGFVLGRTPQTFSPAPAPPDLNAQLPYRYARTVANDVPQYYRLPSAEEEVATSEAVGRLREKRAALAVEPAAQAEAEMGAAASAANPTPQVANPVAEGEAGAGATEVDSVSAEAPDPFAGILPEYVRMTMRPGFYVSVDGYETAPSGRRYARTVRGAYVPADRLVMATPSPFHGVAISDGLAVPRGFVHFAKAETLSRDPELDGWTPTEPVTRFYTFEIQGPLVQVAGKDYWPNADGRLIEARAVRVASRIERPALVPPRARWVDVNLEQQVLVAYEADTPVYATLVATGKPGYETPTGLYRMHAKHVSTTMDGDDGADEMYSIEDVPWTMYFSGSLALHGAFWHDRFGRVRSHGCVNLAPSDARFLFHWTRPELPPGFHGVMPDLRAASSYVLIRDGASVTSLAER